MQVEAVPQHPQDARRHVAGCCISAMTEKPRTSRGVSLKFQRMIDHGRTLRWRKIYTRKPDLPDSLDEQGSSVGWAEQMLQAAPKEELIDLFQNPP